MRTYKLQDGGLDTVDANTTLGFDDDEREYGVAVRMLQMLGCTRVVLLTNNPAKLDGLAKAGIEITGRMPLETPINADNRRYMTAKAARAGHQLGHLMSALAEAKESEEKGAAARALNSGAAPRRWIRGRRCPCSATARRRRPTPRPRARCIGSPRRWSSTMIPIGIVMANFSLGPAGDVLYDIHRSIGAVLHAARAGPAGLPSDQSAAAAAGRHSGDPAARRQSHALGALRAC